MVEDKIIIKKINKALDMLYEYDRYLLQYDVNEVSISHKLACYLQFIFKNLDVDIEFNRNLCSSKRVDNDVRKPDIIIHKRGTNEHNLIAIEVKKDNNKNPNNDFKKLKKIMREYGYKYGIFIELRIEDEISRENFVKKIKLFINR
ncbi:restriction endonuclease [Caminibacter pacificus]